MSDGLKMRYFVLKPKGHDVYAEASRLAMEAYAAAIKADNPELSTSLRSWVTNERTAAIRILKESSPKEVYGYWSRGVFHMTEDKTFAKREATSNVRRYRLTPEGV